MITIYFYERASAQYAGHMTGPASHLRLITITAYCDLHGVDAVIESVSGDI